jgi:exonuclease III
MSILSWNCQGLGNPWIVKNLHDLVKENKPTILFLMETRMKENEIDQVRRRIGFTYAFVVPSRRRKGGLAMLWNASDDIEIKNYSISHINAVFRDDKRQVLWRITGFYGAPKKEKRKASWQLLHRLGDQNILPWIVIGDFNEILVGSEKFGKAEKRESQMQDFRDILDQCQLRDLGYRGPWFTWDNRRQGTENIRERLDRAVASNEWMELYPNAMVKHLIAAA